MSVNIEHLLQGNTGLSSVTGENFPDYALAVFRYQFACNEIYRAYVQAIGKSGGNIGHYRDIPFLPISFFKTHRVLSGTFAPALVFESSGTTGSVSSRHYVKEPALYGQSFMLAFEQFYGAPENYVFLCLLPSYLERGNSSLVYMADTLIRKSNYRESGFYLDEWAQLAALLQEQKAAGRKVMLLGVTFALLDFAEAYPMDLSGVTVMETGGMKGRREEWTREQVHGFLKERWNLGAIHSEYGMTELLSQAYAYADGLFQAPEWTRFLTRDENDPFEVREEGSGCLNIIDLANIHSCAFIATDDVATLDGRGGFRVIGRRDNADLRGCSLMAL